MNLLRRTEARRFITMIDTFYDNKVRWDDSSLPHHVSLVYNRVVSHPPPLLTQLHTPLLGKIQPPLRLSGTFRPFVFGSEEWDDRFCWSLLGHLGEDNLFSRGLAWKPVWSFSSPTQTKRRTKATYGWPRYHWCKYTTLRGSRWAPLKVNNGG